MSAKTIRISSVDRTTASGDTETLALKPGVNVIVGDKGTGKTAWIKTISFLLGDTDSAADSLKLEISEKFDMATMRLNIGEDESVIERRWKEAGAKTSVIIDGQSIKKDESSQFFLNKLNIPVVRFPKGNPYSGSKWPQLSWRMLFRHIYRQERFWADLADKQPEKEQHACIAQFLGVADRVFPTELGQEIDKHRELLKFQARKEQFEEVLQQTARDIVPDPSISNSPTLDAIDRGVARLRTEIDQFRTERENTLAALINAPSVAKHDLADIRLGERRMQLSSVRVAERDRMAEVENRFAELSTYRDQLKAELGRLRRAETAGELFKPLAVTCCPYCDQRISPDGSHPNQCFVCHRPISSLNLENSQGMSKRLIFEIEQMEGEESELADLIGRLGRERESIRGALRRLDEELAEVEVQLRPMRAAVSAILPPEMAVLDTRIGQWEEKVAQLQRFRLAVERRDDLSVQIDQLQSEVDTLSGYVDSKGDAIPYEQLSDAMSDGINDYLNLVMEGDRSRWPHERVEFDFSASSVRVRVGKKSWTSLSNADQGYVLLGYHYALLSLAGKCEYNYPGLALIDFPMNFADKTSVSDRENFLIEPFVKLAKSNPQVQIVVCGRSFAGLKGVHRIELEHVWRQGDSLTESDGKSGDSE